jgi:hypothetical protein
MDEKLIEQRKQEAALNEARHTLRTTIEAPESQSNPLSRPAHKSRCTLRFRFGCQHWCRELVGWWRPRRPKLSSMVVSDKTPNIIHCRQATAFPYRRLPPLAPHRPASPPFSRACTHKMLRDTCVRSLHTCCASVPGVQKGSYEFEVCPFRDAKQVRLHPSLRAQLV